MKKILLLASSVALMFAAGSCQKEINHLDGDVNVTFDVSAGEVATRAIADATNIDVLYWEIYNTADIAVAAGPLGEGVVRDSDGDKKFQVSLRLLADQDYTIVFWAQVDGQNHYVVDDLRNIVINTYSDENANDESRAAFFNTHAFHTNNGKAINEEVTLYRPFAQINLGSTTYETSLNQVNGGKITVNSTEMTVTSIANMFNTLDKVGVSDPTFDGTVTFKAAATPNGTADQDEKLLKVNGETYYWLGMNYLIVEGETDNVDVDLKVNTNMGVVSHTVTNVPIRKNYRTNILGDLLTTGATFNIVVDERFEVPDYIVDPNRIVVHDDMELNDVFATYPEGTIYFANDITAQYIQADNGGNYVMEVNGHTINSGDGENYALIIKESTSVTMNDAILNCGAGGIGITNNSNVVFNSGSVKTGTLTSNARYNFYVSGSTLTINGGTFSFASTGSIKRSYVYADATSVVYIKGGKFGKPSTHNDYKSGILGAGTVIITGGEFGFNPSKWVPATHKAEKSGNVWIVSEI